MKWEYKTIKLAVGNFEGANFELLEVDKFINQLGQKDWELVSSVGIVLGAFAYPNTKNIVLFFKRPLPE